MSQPDTIDQLSNKELLRALVLSQLLFVLLAFGLSIFLFDHVLTWLLYFSWDSREIFIYGVLPGIVIVVVDILLIYVLPKRYYDDGGINERIFRSLSFPQLVIVTLLIAIAEELLFRGVLQTTFGYIIASFIFAMVHVRYLKKPVLLVSVLILSFFIGYLFEITGNLLVTITCHFIIDFLLGLFIRYKLGGITSE